MTTTALVYLARGSAGAPQSIQCFLNSYLRFDAGAAHKLHVLLKGWTDEAAAALEAERFAAIGATLHALPDDGYDWGAYIRAAACIDTDELVFLNTHSEILARDWLNGLVTALRAPGVMVAGATGSWSSLRPDAQLLWRMSQAAGRPAWRNALSTARAMTRDALRFRSWPRFPNAHIRSNAFAIRRQDFASFAAGHPFPAGKLDTWGMENGIRSLTRWAQAAGGEVVVVTARGEALPPADWRRSAPFRSPQQSHLIVADNQTRDYATASPERKRLLEVATWGEILTPASA